MAFSEHTQKNRSICQLKNWGLHSLYTDTEGMAKQEHYLLCNFSSETVSFFLPAALREDNTLRPFAVDILSMKPCLFLLFLCDG